ncbi:MAG TPA: hypothetical protein VMD75_17915 [Candidatus Binataceae bacterium]|nr:hypothetical protein [Candidatus Binataceae bacterium]
MKKLATLGACLAVVSAIALGVAVTNGYAASGVKVDCTQVMTELNGGKKPKEVASDMKISVSSVYRCRHRAHHMAGGSSTHASSTSAAPMATPAAASH